MAEYDCRKCKSRCAWKGADGPDQGKCLVGYTPTTNADRIRAMSDEELAEWLATAIARHYNEDAVVASMDSVLWLKWLKEVNE